ncbi:adhesin [Pseudomonas sp. UL073]|uniref:Adhesin n=1 Tax=Zestomonas insulae TaxID=2809017 RepID=A0ABS2IFZ2_9GAMM|nr:adhesin [Pseudomonas insulae]MBM7061996.1 adhesin [Pseudomonas insulae]
MRSLLFMSLGALLIGPALADNATPQMNATIQAAGQAYRGNLMTNQAAGDQQQQVNARAIGAGDHSQTAIRVQQANTAIGNRTVDARASIGGAAYSQGSGVVGVNQGAGVANQQINAFRLELNAPPESLDDSALAQNAAPVTNSGVGVPQSGERTVEMDDGAFAGSRGVVQLNQSAGVGNRTANNLSIRVVD